MPDICVLYFFYHSFYRKDQFIVVILKFGTEDFTDLGLQYKDLADPHWFVVVVLPSQEFPRVAKARNNMTISTVA